jgi:L-fuconolactonase
MTPMVAAVVGGNPAAEGFDKYLASFKGNPYVKGMRQVLHVPETPVGYCLQKPFVRSVQALGEQGLSFDLCMRHAELLDAAKLVKECPNTRFILDHCGNGPVKSNDRSAWEKSIAAVAECPNVVGKVSGIVAQLKPGEWSADHLAPLVNHTLEVFGPDRVMFGGDWPVCTLAASFRQWVAALAAIVADRPRAQQQKLFADNAIKFYGLK